MLQGEQDPGAVHTLGFVAQKDGKTKENIVRARAASPSGCASQWFASFSKWFCSISEQLQLVIDKPFPSSLQLC